MKYVPVAMLAGISFFLLTKCLLDKYYPPEQNPTLFIAWGTDHVAAGDTLLVTKTSKIPGQDTIYINKIH